MILTQLPVHQTWVFVDGVLTVKVGGHYTHQSRQEAVSRAEEAGLVVDTDGHVTPRQTAGEGRCPDCDAPSPEHPRADWCRLAGQED